jgi:hypothetical protein
MTDTDRELLELAAKAAVYNMAEVSDGYPMYIEGYGLWNPLEDDGDALRLAVKLEMQVSIGLRRINVAVYVDRGMNALPFNTREVNSDDPLAATRRAIVRAAAEIGRSMK